MRTDNQSQAKNTYDRQRAHLIKLEADRLSYLHLQVGSSLANIIRGKETLT